MRFDSLVEGSSDPAVLQEADAISELLNTLVTSKRGALRNRRREIRQDVEQAFDALRAKVPSAGAFPPPLVQPVPQRIATRWKNYLAVFFAGIMIALLAMAVVYFVFQQNLTVTFIHGGIVIRPKPTAPNVYTKSTVQAKHSTTHRTRRSATRAMSMSQRAERRERLGTVYNRQFQSKVTSSCSACADDDEEVKDDDNNK